MVAAVHAPARAEFVVEAECGEGRGVDRGWANAGGGGANSYAIAWNLHNAKKAETRERRMKKYLEMMRKGERLH